MIIVTHKTYIAPDLSTAFCLRPHEAFAARMKITMFTFRERVCEQSTWFNLHMMMSRLNTFKILIKNNENQLSWDYFKSCTYQDDYKDGSCEAPDECVMDGEPAEVWVSITLRVKTYCQTYAHTKGT